MSQINIDFENSLSIAKEFNNGNKNIKIVSSKFQLYMIEYDDNYETKRYTRILEFSQNIDQDPFSYPSFPFVPPKPCYMTYTLSIKLGIFNYESYDSNNPLDFNTYNSSYPYKTFENYSTVINSYEKKNNKIIAITNKNGKRYKVYDFKDIKEVL